MTAPDTTVHERFGRERGVPMACLRTLVSVLAVLLLLTEPAGAVEMNGFDLGNAQIPIAAIERGGPPRDGIPALDAPRFTAVAQTHWLKPQDRVLGIHHNGVARAYPVAILNWHEIVNDRIGGKPVAVTYCPLCGSGVAFSAHLEERDLHFGVSGLLYNSDVLLYDRETESLWSQILGKAISGKLAGAALERIPLLHTTWQDWRDRFPQGEVLSTETGFRRDYSRNPYQGYEGSRRIWFSVSGQDERLHPKAWVIGVEIEGAFKAYPFDELALTNGEVSDTLGGEAITLHYDSAHRSAWVTDAQGKTIAAVTAYWFAWQAFHPDTALFTANGHGAGGSPR